MPFDPISTAAYNILQAFMRAVMTFCHVVWVERTQKSVDVGRQHRAISGAGSAARVSFVPSLFPPSSSFLLSPFRHIILIDDMDSSGTWRHRMDGANTHADDCRAPLSAAGHCHVLLRYGLHARQRRSLTSSSRTPCASHTTAPHRSPRPLRLPLIATSAEFLCSTENAVLNKGLSS